MTYSRRYPSGEGVTANGTIYTATLVEEDEVFAAIGRAPGERREGTRWKCCHRRPSAARERSRYALACFSDELKRLGV